MQQDLFNYESKSINNNIFSNIPGLKYVDDFISEDHEDYLLNYIDSQDWDESMNRRVQHYGYKYNYRARKVTKSTYLGDIPIEFITTTVDIVSEFMKYGIDQVIVNEYLPGQGITPHIDCEPCFRDVIISLSLCSPCIMNFINIEDDRKIDIWMEPRSIVVLSGDARYKWMHGISPRKNDTWNGIKYPRERRVSITFRKVILEDNFE